MWHRDWTVYELAGEAGVAPRTLTEYLAGRLPISSTNLVKLARVLECKPEQLLDPQEEAAS
jgi:transcriptional regulator with XRE-family HTH domain